METKPKVSPGASGVAGQRGRHRVFVTGADCGSGLRRIRRDWKTNKTATIENMVQVHMSDAEVAGNFSAALAKVRQGLEIVVEHEHRPVAVLKSAPASVRTISECIAMLPPDSAATIDADFGADVEGAIAAHPEALEPSAWE